MGQAITKIFSLTAREVKTFNLEKRAEKIISKDKPTPAPKLPSTVKELERLKKENVSTEYLYKKDEQLDDFLKKVYVKTPDPAPPLERKIDPNRPLPVKGPSRVGMNYGYSESEEAAIPEGRVSLKQALEFINNHQTDPKKYSNAAIASQYKISLDDTNEILEHFKMLAVKVNKKEVDPDSLPVYERLQHRIKQMTAFNASAILKEITSVYGKEESKEDSSASNEKSIVANKPAVKILDTGTKTEKTKEGSDAEASVREKGQDRKDIQKEGKIEDAHGKIRRKAAGEIKEGPTRKHSQENG